VYWNTSGSPSSFHGQWAADRRAVGKERAARQSKRLGFDEKSCPRPVKEALIKTGF